MGEWRQKLATQGWIAPAWPKEYGGAGLSTMEQFILNEEFAEARAPQLGGMGVQMAGPTIIIHGTEEQKAEAEAQKVYADLKKLVSDLQERQRLGEEIDRAELEAKLAQLRIQESYINRQLAVTKQRLERARLLDGGVGRPPAVARALLGGAFDRCNVVGRLQVRPNVVFPQLGDPLG